MWTFSYIFSCTEFHIVIVLLDVSLTVHSYIHERYGRKSLFPFLNSFIHIQESLSPGARERNRTQSSTAFINLPIPVQSLPLYPITFHRNVLRGEKVQVYQMLILWSLTRPQTTHYVIDHFRTPISRLCTVMYLDLHLLST